MIICAANCLSLTNARKRALTWTVSVNPLNVTITSWTHSSCTKQRANLTELSPKFRFSHSEFHSCRMYWRVHGNEFPMKCDQWCKLSSWNGVEWISGAINSKQSDHELFVSTAYNHIDQCVSGNMNQYTSNVKGHRFACCHTTSGTRQAKLLIYDCSSRNSLDE